MLRIVLVTILVVGASASAMLAAISWRRRPAVGAVLYAGLMLSVATYAFGYSLELLSLNQPEMLLSIRIEYLGVAQIPALWLSLALFYTNRMEWISPRHLIILWIIPIVVILAVLTNDLHHLFYISTSINEAGPFPTLITQRGPIYWLHAGYSFISFFGVVYLLARLYPSAQALYRRQTIVMIIASLVTITITGLHFAGITPLPGLDIIPFAFLLSGIILGWGIFNFRLIELMPVAHDVLFKQMADGVLVLDDKNNLIDFNSSAGKLFNLPAEAVGQPVAHYLSTDAPSMIESLKTNQSYRELAIEKDSTRYFDVNIEKFRLSHNRSGGSLVVIHDVTQRKEAESLLQKSELLYRLLAENSNDVIWTMDLEGHFMYVSPSVERMRGFTPDEVMRQTLDEAFCVGSQGLILDHLNRAQGFNPGSAAARPEYLEIEQPVKNGGTVWTEMTARLVYDENGAPLSLMGISRDIKDRKEIEMELQNTLNELTLFNQAMVGREIRMIELKQEINDLLANAGQPEKYLIPEP